MVGVSSSSWLYRMPSFLPYTASKAFASYLSIAIDYELRHAAQTQDGGRIDLIEYHCFVPGSTATNIVDSRHKGPFHAYATPVDKAVKANIKDWGRYGLSYGTAYNEFVQKFTYNYFGAYMGWLYESLFYNIGYYLTHN